MNIYDAIGVLQKFNAKATEKGVTLNNLLNSLFGMTDVDKFDEEESGEHLDQCNR